jgi:hypothetical protein
VDRLGLCRFGWNYPSALLCGAGLVLPGTDWKRSPFSMADLLISGHAVVRNDEIEDGGEREFEVAFDGVFKGLKPVIIGGFEEGERG